MDEQPLKPGRLIVTRPIQLIFTGAGGTGKTTLAKKVAEASDILLVPSVSRIVQAEFGITEEDQQKTMNPELRWEMQQEISRRQAEDLSKAMDAGACITDRSPLDHLCYAVLKSREWMSPDTLRFFENRALRLLQRSLLVVYFPIDVFTPEPDGFRTGDEVERTTQDTLIRGYLDRWRGLFNLMRMTVDGSRLRATHLQAQIQHLLTRP